MRMLTLAHSLSQVFMIKIYSVVHLREDCGCEMSEIFDQLETCELLEGNQAAAVRNIC